ncbi:hypothetical protein GDO81_021135 [Engystomops pustulosus]|uniref:Uncharacterized protein n=1 Tax=Engystomops pustulosus TaxID=76066 RepID=A0AAV6Z6V4_ENGPU|nr:hypothetical protein GDO81_021135 [Engystomops pustulosus]
MRKDPSGFGPGSCPVSLRKAKLTADRDNHWPLINTNIGDVYCVQDLPIVPDGRFQEIVEWEMVEINLLKCTITPGRSLCCSRNR